MLWSAIIWGRKRENFTGEEWRMRRYVLLGCFATLAACGSGDAPSPPDPAMDAEVRAAVASGMAVQARMMETGGFEPLVLTGKRMAPGKFDGKDVICATKADGGARVMIVDLVEFVDGPMQGPWFDYLWRRSGC